MKCLPERMHPPALVKTSAVFDKHHVDIVFNGHNHWYERIGPLKGNGDSEQGIPVDDPSKGTIYIVTGGAGAMTYQSVLSTFCPGAKGSKVCFDKFHYVALKIDYNHLDVTAWEAKQQLFGYSDSNRKQVDHFVIDKPVPDQDNPCLNTSDGAEKPDSAPDTPPDQGNVEPAPEPIPEPVPDSAEETAINDLQYNDLTEMVSTSEMEDALEALTDAGEVDGLKDGSDIAAGQDTKPVHTPSGGCHTGQRPIGGMGLLLVLFLAVLYRKRRV